MRRVQVCLAALALAAAQPLAAAADDEPEAVYAKYHRAVLAGNVEEVLRTGTEAQRAQMASKSAAQNAAQLKAMAATMPPTYALRGTILDPSGQNARLYLSGPGAAPAGGTPATLYATVFMVMQRAEWKVAAAGWSNRDPGLPPQASQAGRDPGTYAPTNTSPPAAPRRPGAPQRTSAESRAGATLPVGALDSAPERKLGVQKPPCVYKPVMTAEDLENCK